MCITKIRYMHVHKHTLDFEDENITEFTKVEKKWDLKNLQERSSYDIYQSNKKNAHRLCSVKR